MGSGKSSVGKRLANRLGLDFVDMDVVIEEYAQATVEDIFSQSGEETFRLLENHILEKLISEEPRVIATGGGSPCHSGNMERMLENGLCVYLELTARKLHKRITASNVKNPNKRPLVKGLEGKELYILDYSYSFNELEDLISKNKSVLVIDHHKSAQDAVKAFPGNVFDLDHSGAVLAWEHFHPGTPVPRLLLYIEDGDLWKRELPNNREFGAALAEYRYDFAAWDKLATDLDDDTHWNKFIERGAIISDFENRLVNSILEYREKVECEGYEIYAVNAERTYRSILGHRLANINQKEGRDPFGIVYYRYEGMWHCSLRSHGGFDVSVIAEKYGGGGHPGAASIRAEKFEDLPFTFVA